MEGHDKATAMDILNIPADLVSEEWQDYIRETYKERYIQHFKEQVAWEIKSEEEARLFQGMMKAVEIVGSETFEKLMAEGNLGKALEDLND